MRFVYGFVGAIVGIVVGGASTVLLLAAIFRSDILGFAFTTVILGWIGLVVGAIAGIIVSQFLWRWWRKGQEADRTKSNAGVILASWIVLPLLASWGMLWGSTRFDLPPSDLVLLENFARHRAEFDQLADMVEKDQGLRRIDVDTTDPDDPSMVGVSTERVARYRQLLAKVNVPEGIETTEGQTEVDFLYWGTGSAISSDTDKGYAYLVQAPAKTLDSLDGCTGQGNKSIQAYRHITGNWYLFYEYEPE